MTFKILMIVVAVAVAFTSANAETHTVTLNNRCGLGTPTLIKGGTVLSTGNPYTSTGPLDGAIAYLQIGSCGLDGEQCTLVETTLKNPTTPGGGSSTDISLVPPHNFTVAAGFSYQNGCDGQGTTCGSAGCTTAFHAPDDTGVQVACQVNDVNLAITFC